MLENFVQLFFCSSIITVTEGQGNIVPLHE